MNKGSMRLLALAVGCGFILYGLWGLVQSGELPVWGFALLAAAVGALLLICGRWMKKVEAEVAKARTEAEAAEAASQGQQGGNPDLPEKTAAVPADKQNTAKTEE